MTYRTADPPNTPQPAKIDVEDRGDEYRLVVLSGEPKRGDCSECGHMVGHVTWWCDAPGRTSKVPHNTGNCELWKAPDRVPTKMPAELPAIVTSWWRRLLAHLVRGHL